MKKLVSIVLAAVLTVGALFTFVGCGSKGITIAVPNDTTNEARALLLLQENGYIKLKDGAGITATIRDIVEKPDGVTFKETEAAQLPNQLQDVDYAVINSNYAIAAKLNPVKDALAIEGSSSAYGNILAVKEGNENTPKIKALVAALKSKKVAEYIAATYDGAVVSTVTEPGDGFDGSLDYAALAGTTVSVAASPTPHAEILKIAKGILAEKDITLDIKEFTDYVQPNTALVDGDLDANYFQHTPYLNNFNKENGTDLAAAFDMHYEPFGIYAGKTASIEELKDGASIAIPNDGSNETRALLLLQDAGLIKLKDGIDPTSDATKLDITENPKNLDIQEIAAEQLPRSLADVDLAVINGNYALQADLNAAEDSLITENPDFAKVYVNVVACRSGEENSDKIQALKKALQSDDVKKYVDETYKGAVVTVF